MSNWRDQLNLMKFNQFIDLFSSHSSPKSTELIGVYRGAFVGPSWLRILAGPALYITGLSGWWGKRFHADGCAFNLVLRDEELADRFPMQLIETVSALDGKPVLALHYDPGNPFPWTFIVDELRQLGTHAYLGMTYVNKGALRKLAFPFLLEYKEQDNGL